MKTCCGFGHRENGHYQSDMFNTAIDYAVSKGCTEFLCGGMGAFDSCFVGAVALAKKRYPEKDLKLYLVIPYFTKELERNQNFYYAMYDEIIYPDCVDGAHPKGAVMKRNRWMVDKSDVIISNVHYSFGGAYQTIRYAEKKRKHIHPLCFQSVSAFKEQ